MGRHVNQTALYIFNICAKQKRLVSADLRGLLVLAVQLFQLSQQRLPLLLGLQEPLGSPPQLLLQLLQTQALPRTSSSSSSSSYSDRTYGPEGVA